MLASFAGGARLGLGGNRLVLARSTVEAARAGLGVVLAGRTILAVVIAIVALYICDVCEQVLARRALCVILEFACRANITNGIRSFGRFEFALGAVEACSTSAGVVLSGLAECAPAGLGTHQQRR